VTIESPVPSKTPNYVLLEGKDRIGPNLIPTTVGPAVSVIYGFSDKGPYDRFMAGSSQVLRPYPLVTGYLRDSDSVPDAVLRLVAIDANGPNDSCLHAARIDQVSDAQRNRDINIQLSHRLLFDKTANAYAIEET